MKRIFLSISILLMVTMVAGINAAAEITTWDQLYNAMQAGGNITLTQDIYYSGTKKGIIIPNGKTVVLDLNGYGLYRGLAESSAEKDGYVIKVEKGAKLTIKDSSKSPEYPYGKGFIQGGNSIEPCGGGVYVNGGGSLVFEGGQIRNNK